MSKTKFAIGCLVQWYEVEMVWEYVKSIKSAIQDYEGDVAVDVVLSIYEGLEQRDNTSKSMQEVEEMVMDMFYSLPNTEFLHFKTTSDLITIADYRRDFNSRYCTQVDVLVWGESDMLLPREAFLVLDSLHKAAPTSKYVATFGICKMWDPSWKILEHPDFTDKPFIENDYDNWWSVKYTMSIEEMNDINRKVEQPEIITTTEHKFNGCGLVISSEVIKAGVNIPQSIFFVHEDTSFMLMLKKILPDSPQFIIKNILNVHNRNHPKKRMHVRGEVGDTLNKRRRSNEWYVRANKYSEENCYNLFNLTHRAKTWTDVWK